MTIPSELEKKYFVNDLGEKIPLDKMDEYIQRQEEQMLSIDAAYADVNVNAMPCYGKPKQSA